MAGQKDIVGNNFPVYKVNVAVHNFLLKSTIPSVLGTKGSGLWFYRDDGSPEKLETVLHCKSVSCYLPKRLVHEGPHHPLLGEKICGQLIKTQI